VTDVFTKEKRSEVMSLIRGRGNKATEITLAKLFRRNKITGCGGAKKSSARRISFFQNSSSRFLWTVVSGMVAQSTELNQKATAHSGKINSLATRRVIFW
jgi:hypothetical protein